MYELPQCCKTLVKYVDPVAYFTVGQVQYDQAFAVGPVTLLVVILLVALALWHRSRLPRLRSSCMLIQVTTPFKAPRGHLPIALKARLPTFSSSGRPSKLQPSHDCIFRNRPGPKSRSCSTCAASSLRWVLLVLLVGYHFNLVAATDARVGSQTHRRDPGAPHQAPHETLEAKSGGLRHTDSLHNFPPGATPKKRALRRAISRASQNEDHCTWYRGRRLHLSTLRSKDSMPGGGQQACKPSLSSREPHRLQDRHSEAAGGLLELRRVVLDTLSGGAPLVA